MVRGAVVLSVMAFALTRDCGGDDHPGGANAPCTRSKDCEHELECQEGVCVHPGAVPVDDTRDASDDGG